MTDLTIYITDENGNAMGFAEIYQDGSDSEDANRIIKLLKHGFPQADIKHFQQETE